MQGLPRLSRTTRDLFVNCAMFGTESACCAHAAGEALSFR